MSPLGNIRTRVRSRALAAGLLVAACFLIVSAAATLPSQAASSATIVSANVPSSTTLDASGCVSGQANQTDFGSALPGAALVTSLDCDIQYGSSNDTATLRAYQPDGRGAALNTSTTAATETTASGQHTYGMDFGTSSIGWIVGDNGSPGSMLKTTDGGSTWATVASGVGSWNAVDAISGTVAWGARASGARPYLTTDGTNWNLKTFTNPGATTTTLLSITGIDATNAWASGYEVNGGVTSSRIWRTVDGGTNWTELCPACGSLQMFDIQWVTGTTVVAIDGSGKVWRSTDGDNFTNVFSGTAPMRGITRFTASDLAIVGLFGRSWYSSDGGATWALSLTMPTQSDLRTVSGQSDGTGVAVGSRGTILSTSDYGKHWATIRLTPDDANIQTAAIPTSGTFIAATSGSSVYQSLNSGSTWTNATGVTAYPNWIDIDTWDASRIIRVGSRGAVSISTDGGASWGAATYPAGNNASLDSVTFVNRSVVLAVGTAGTVLRSTDAGATWSTVTVPGPAQPLFDVNGTENAMWAAGGAGKLLFSGDQGLTWSVVPSGFTDDLFAVDGWSSTNVIVGTDTGGARYSTNGGVSWTMSTGLVMVPVLAVDAIPGTTVVWAANQDDLDYSSNGGVSFTSTDFNDTMYDVDGFDANNAWGASGITGLFHSTNASGSWTTFSGLPANKSYYGVVNLGPQYAIAVGDGNTTAAPNPGNNFPDYSGTEWGTSNGLFAMCLRAAAGAVSTWPTTGTCSAANGTNWRAVPLNGGLAASMAASTSGPGSLTASFRFGLNVAAAQSPGTYLAPIQFEVTAPSG